MFNCTLSSGFYIPDSSITSNVTDFKYNSSETSQNLLLVSSALKQILSGSFLENITSENQACIEKRKVEGKMVVDHVSDSTDQFINLVRNILDGSINTLSKVSNELPKLIMTSNFEGTNCTLQDPLNIQLNLTDIDKASALASLDILTAAKDERMPHYRSYIDSKADADINCTFQKAAAAKEVASKDITPIIKAIFTTHEVSQQPEEFFNTTALKRNYRQYD